MKFEFIRSTRLKETFGRALFFFPRFILFLTAVLPCGAEPSFSAQDAWLSAVSHRAQQETVAPQILRYLQYQLDEAGTEKSRETGIWAFSYSADGKATIEVRTAIKDGKDFTEERRRRLNRGKANTTQMLDILSPFDERAQAVLRLGTGSWTENKGQPAWEYSFELPRGDRTLVGTAWVDALKGSPLVFVTPFVPCRCSWIGWKCESPLVRISHLEGSRKSSIPLLPPSSSLAGSEAG